LILIGVFGLSSTEISADLQELEQTLDDDTDSISSVSSAEVLKSTYPVKPRGSLHFEKEDFDLSQEDSYSPKHVNNSEIEEALLAIKSFATSHKQLYDAEIERQDLEASYRVSVPSYYLIRFV